MGQSEVQGQDIPQQFAHILLGLELVPGVFCFGFS